MAMTRLIKRTGGGVLVVAGWVVWAQAPATEPIESLLATSCSSCHSGSQAAGDLRLDSLAALAKGGKSGPAVVAGNAAASLLFQRVVTSDRRCECHPASSPLSAEKIALLKSWIEKGHGMPRVRVEFGRLRSRSEADSASLVLWLPQRRHAESAAPPRRKGGRDESGSWRGNCPRQQRRQPSDPSRRKAAAMRSGCRSEARLYQTNRSRRSERWIDGGAIWPAAAETQHGARPGSTGRTSSPSGLPFHPSLEGAEPDRQLHPGAARKGEARVLARKHRRKL